MDRLLELEAAHEKSLWDIDAILLHEESRMSETQALLAEHDKDTMHMQLQSTEYQLEQLEEEYISARTALQNMKAEKEQLESSLQSKLRELENLRTELSAVQNTSVDIESLQTTNQDMERELSTLKSEVLRLRSQNESHQFVLSEKLSLERQLNTLELELREAKALKPDRKTAKGPKARKVPASKVASEEESEEAEQAEEMPLVDEEESPEDSLPPSPKMKRAGVPSSTTKSKPQKGSTRSVPLKEPQEKGSQSDWARMAPDEILMTPGGIHVSKMPQRTSAAPGDKSFFSTTPFLNKSNMDYEDTTEEESDENLESRRSRPVQKPKRRNISDKASNERRAKSPSVEKPAVKTKGQPRQRSKKPKIDDDDIPSFQPSYLGEATRYPDAAPDRGFRYNIGGTSAAGGQNMRQKIRLGRNKFIEASEISPLKRKMR